MVRHVAESSRDSARAGPTDAELVQRVADGDRGALAALYDRHGGALLALGQRLLRNRREAEDLLHDVFIEAWRHAADYDAARGSVRSWLLLRLRSRALDRLKSVGYARITSFDPEVHEQQLTPDPQPSLAGADAALVRDAMAALAPDQRTVLELAYFEGLSLSDISTRLGVPLGTIKSRLARALERLRGELAALREGAP